MPKGGIKIPNAGEAAVQGILTDTELQPFNYLINAAATLGVPITIDGKTYDFTGKGAMDTQRVVSDKMAQTLLDLQREKSPEIIQQRLNELKAADPKGYEARQQLFKTILQDAHSNPDRPVSTDLQKLLQQELSKGAGFDDVRQEQQVRDASRGKQVARGIYLGAAPTLEEASDVLNAGESLRDSRQQNALALLQSGASPEDVAYRKFQQAISNLANFASGNTPSAQFGKVSSTGGPATLTGLAPNTNTFNPNAAGQGLDQGLDIYSGQLFQDSQSMNPWLANLSVAAHTWGNMNKTGWGGKV